MILISFYMLNDVLRWYIWVENVKQCKQLKLGYDDYINSFSVMESNCTKVWDKNKFQFCVKI